MWNWRIRKSVMPNHESAKYNTYRIPVSRNWLSRHWDNCQNKTSDISTILIEIWWEFHVGQVFQAQSKFPVKGDWTEQVRIDLEDSGIQENFDWIKSKSVNSFKRLVKKKAKQYALSELLRMKSIHSRLDNIEYTELKTQKYLSSGLVSASQGEFC